MAIGILYQSEESQVIKCRLSSHLFGLLHTTLLLSENKPNPQLKHLPGCLACALFFTDILICPIRLAWHPLPRLLGTWDTGTLGPKIGAESFGATPRAPMRAHRARAGVLRVALFPGLPVAEISRGETSSCSQSSLQSVGFVLCFNPGRYSQCLALCPVSVLEKWRVTIYSRRNGLFGGKGDWLQESQNRTVDSNLRA